MSGRPGDLGRRRGLAPLSGGLEEEADLDIDSQESDLDIDSQESRRQLDQKIMRVYISYTHLYPIMSLNHTSPSRKCKLCF